LGEQLAVGGPKTSYLQPRRWAALGDRLSPGRELSELGPTHDEAKTALLAIAPQIGNKLIRIRRCNPDKEKYVVTIRDWEGQEMDYPVPAETVDHVVRSLRIMVGGDGTVPMPRLRDNGGMRVYGPGAAKLVDQAIDIASADEE
jgi:hypothetical protein